MATYKKRLKNKNGDVIHPVTTVDTNEIENEAVTSTKIDMKSLADVGIFVPIASTRLASNTTGTEVLETTIPEEYRGNPYEYKLEISMENYTQPSQVTVVYIQVKQNNTWQTGTNKYAFNAFRNGSTVDYSTSSGNAYGFEWYIVNSYDSFSATATISRASRENCWNIHVHAGGMSYSLPAVYSGGGRTQSTSPIQAFRMKIGQSVTWVNGSHLTIFARKAINGGA